METVSPVVVLAVSTRAEDYVVDLSFSDGTQKRVDLTPYLRGPIFEPLKDPAYFRNIEVDEDSGTIGWPNGANIDPLVLRYGLSPAADERDIDDESSSTAVEIVGLAGELRALQEKYDELLENREADVAERDATADRIGKVLSALATVAAGSAGTTALGGAPVGIVLEALILVVERLNRHVNSDEDASSTRSQTGPEALAEGNGQATDAIIRSQGRSVKAVRVASKRAYRDAALHKSMSQSHVTARKIAGLRHPARVTGTKSASRPREEVHKRVG